MVAFAGSQPYAFSMCLILLAWHAHPEYPLVLAANRDEFFARPTAPAAWWQAPAMLAGRDLAAGGTWLGVTRDGRIAALTNYRDPTSQRADAPSRGTLVPAVLTGGAPVHARLSELHRTAARYNGFNVLFSDSTQLASYESVPDRSRMLGSGVYGLSNHLLDTPWPKVVTAKAALGSALAQLPEDQGLLALLRDEARPDDSRLPRTGVSLSWERLLSSAFIRAPGYGTRSSTIVVMDRGGQVRFREWTWNEQGELAGEVDYQFETMG